MIPKTIGWDFLESLAVSLEQVVLLNYMSLSNKWQQHLLVSIVQTSYR